MIAGWGEYTLAFIVLLLAHAIPPRRPARTRLVAALGERGYLGLYSVLSLALLYWLFAAAGRAPHVQLWSVAPWQLWVPNLVVPLAILLALSGVGIANPFSFGGSPARAFDPARPGILRLTRHPLLLAIALWAAAHVVPNGDLAHLLLFGGAAIAALLGMLMLDRRRRRQWGPRRWAELAGGTGRGWPGPGAFPPRRLALAAAVWLLLLALHPWLLGVTPLPPL